MEMTIRLIATLKVRPTVLSPWRGGDKGTKVLEYLKY